MVGLLSSIEGIFGAGGSAALQNVVGDTAERTTITLTSSTLEPALGGPGVGFFSAAIEEFGADGSELPPQPNETYANDQLSGTVLPPQPYPVPALQIAPVLRYSEILEIEKAAQHVVRNTTLYSKAVWLSLSAGRARDPARRLHDRRPAGRRQRREPAGAAAELRAEQAARLLRQLDDHAVHHPAGRRRLDGHRPGRDPAGPAGLPAGELHAAAVHDRAADPGRAGRGRARALPVGGEDRPDPVLELAGLASRHRAGHLAGDAADDDARRSRPG